MQTTRKHKESKHLKKLAGVLSSPQLPANGVPVDRGTTPAAAASLANPASASSQTSRRGAGGSGRSPLNPARQLVDVCHAARIVQSPAC